MIEALKNERAQLAQWLTKTAVMFSMASLQGDLRVTFPPEMTRKVKEGIRPDQCWVDLAYSKPFNSGRSDWEVLPRDQWREIQSKPGAARRLSVYGPIQSPALAHSACARRERDLSELEWRVASAAVPDTGHKDSRPLRIQRHHEFRARRRAGNMERLPGESLKPWPPVNLARCGCRHDFPRYDEPIRGIQVRLPGLAGRAAVLLAWACPPPSFSQVKQSAPCSAWNPFCIRFWCRKTASQMRAGHGVQAGG